MQRWEYGILRVVDVDDGQSLVSFTSCREAYRERAIPTYLPDTVLPTFATKSAPLALALLGDQGWELVATTVDDRVTHPSLPNPRHVREYLFKRPLEEALA